MAEDKVDSLNFGELRFSKGAKENVNAAMEKMYTIAGAENVKKYEENWGELFGYPHNVAVSSGTSADTLACKCLYDFNAKRSLNLEDNEIIAPALAFVAVGTSIVDAGFRPRFVDVKRETLNIDPDKIEEAINDKTRAIMAVHDMGKPCEMDKIMDIAKEHNLYVIEDSCEAHGAEYKGKFVGKWGDMATFSSYVAHLICSVEGGMVSTGNKKIEDSVRSLRNHGRAVGSTYFEHDRLGGNYKMHDLEAAVGLDAISDFWQTFNTRKDNLYYMINSTSDLTEYAHMNIEEEHEVHCPHAFTVTLRNHGEFDYQKLHDYLIENPIMNIAAKRNFGSIPTQHKAFEFLGHEEGEFPEAEYVGTHGIHFGVHQYTTKEQLDKASEVLHTFFKKFKN